MEGCALKRPKYKSKYTVVDGISFQSAWEAEYWQVLCLLEKANLIEKLERQIRYPLVVNTERVGTSVIDFRFTELNEDGHPVRIRLQDTKGYIGKIQTLNSGSSSMRLYMQQQDYLWRLSRKKILGE